ncbi:hypothetical protein LFX15_18415 [Leptospira levettii]|uniref:hypothetical protein n=1 Tax=Leptospira levettii TaxID=2023178 RepID=UPI001EEA4EF6|nr:hypothetical protein [Leptospira levettii]MCG6150278.1 hypothetical protein [Leptospira levettii]
MFDIFLRMDLGLVNLATNQKLKLSGAMKKGFLHFLINDENTFQQVNCHRQEIANFIINASSKEKYEERISTENNVVYIRNSNGFGLK